MDSTLKMEKIVKVLDNKKAVDIQVLDLRGITLIADYFIVCTGNSTTQVKALADNVDEEMSKLGEEPVSREGYNSANWILLDYSDVIVHVFYEEARNFYALERLWADAKNVDIKDILVEGEDNK